ncbi:MAG: hypothetical protein COW65_03220 [Cytophagales bacterium CG18_big_fil_WC_8_21_14_2_50_42_9]|nr:MAG: hypothetical protein COW65_03220 [Cytophagales bacterium CG18_big_fil_WC_8_21_14_2_50_42_9]
MLCRCKILNAQAYFFEKINKSDQVSFARAYLFGILPKFLDSFQLRTLIWEIINIATGISFFCFTSMTKRLMPNIYVLL